ncbi:MAG TPA: hypothetical protein VGH73_13120 [Thermoanaerobaculia bacterium]|jgi:hypothetical protein
MKPMKQREQKNYTRQMKLARGLGWFSIGLGLTQLLAPRWLERQIGLRQDRTGLMRGLGARETMAGVGVLFSDKPTVPLWGRVAGDAMDLALLTAALKVPENEKGRLAGALGMVVGVSLLDFACARMLQTS